MPVPLWVPICQTEHIAKYDSTSSTMPQRSHPGKTSVSASRPAIGDLSTKHGQIPSKVTSSASAIFGTQIGLAHCSKISKSRQMQAAWAPELCKLASEQKRPVVNSFSKFIDFLSFPLVLTATHLPGRKMFLNRQAFEPSPNSNHSKTSRAGQTKPNQGLVTFCTILAWNFHTLALESVLDIAIKRRSGSDSFVSSQRMGWQSGLLRVSFTPRACLSCTSLHINVLFAGPKSTDLKEIMPAVRKLLPKDYFSLGEVLPTAEPAASAASWESRFTSPRVGNQNCGIASKNITAQHKETALRRTTTAQDCSGRCLLTCCLAM